MKVDVNDLVIVDGQLNLVQGITNKLGFNEFAVLNLETGIMKTVTKQKITPALTEQVADLDSLLDGDIMTPTGDDFQDGSTSSGSGKEPNRKRRFKDVSEEDITSLQASSTAKSTDSQTRWAVKILRGRQ